MPSTPRLPAPYAGSPLVVWICREDERVDKDGGTEGDGEEERKAWAQHGTAWDGVHSTAELGYAQLKA